MMAPALSVDRFDAVVIGGGLSGLAAALEIQRRGHRVLVTERRSRLGGLCGTYERDGFRYAIACNDFGSGIRSQLEKLGVRIEFEPRRTIFHFDHGDLALPGDASSVRGLLPIAWPLARFAWGLSRAGDARLQTLIDRCVRDSRARDVVASLAFPFGVAPRDLPTEALRQALSSQGYGYSRPVVPTGGPAAIPRAMGSTLEALGGQVWVDCEAKPVGRDGSGLHQIETAKGTVRAHHLISSEGHWDAYPAGAKEGLAVGMLHLAIREDFPLMPGVHTRVRFPAGVEHWMSRLDSGLLPEDFGFSFYSCDIEQPAAGRTLNVVCLMPRGWDRPSSELARQVEDTLRRGLELVLPGLDSATLARTFVSPAEFRGLHGLSSRPTPWVVPPGGVRPPAHDAHDDRYFVGTSVAGAVDHAGGAIASGVAAGRAVSDRIAKEGASPPVGRRGHGAD